MKDLIFLAGALHFGVLIASALVPQVLDWRADLARVSTLTRRVVWVHGAYIVLVIVAIGSVSLLQADALASHSPLARSVCGFVALFWGGRLLLQYGVLDPTGHLRTRLLRAGYHGLTLVFAFFAFVFGWAAL
ncbi:MAG: hypothetical protein ACYTGZ_16275 [Planctomycetota bacterium]|jgi:hypothetical protein